MNLEILNSVKNCQVKFTEGQNIWALRGRYLYLSNNNGKNWKKHSIIRMDLKKEILTKNNLIRRSLCLDHQILIKLEDSTIIVFLGSGIYRSIEEKKSLHKVFSFQNGRRLLANGATKDLDGNIYFGEYFSNKKRKKVEIFKSEDRGIHWYPVYTFAKGSIRHIHAVQFDNYENLLWIATGDNKKEAKIAYSENGGKTFTFIGKGSPIWKTAGLTFTENYVYWGTDNPKDSNYIYRWSRKDKSIEKLTSIEEAVYYSKKVGDYFLFSTVVEKAKNYKNKYAKIYCLDKRHNFRELYRLKKDIWHPGLFGYGLFEFASGNCEGNNFWVTIKNLAGGERSVLFHLGTKKFINYTFDHVDIEEKEKEKKNKNEQNAPEIQEENSMNFKATAKTSSALMKGFITYIPGINSIFASKTTGGTISPRYCYSIWMRHLCMAYINNILTKDNILTKISTVAELGPGDSLGTGLAALLSGTNKYYAFDVKKYANKERNLQIFDELVSLFKRRESIPDENEFPRVKPYLDSYKFPEYILTDKILNETLKQDRIDSIRNSILELDGGDRNSIKISYFAPWYDSEVIEEAVDMVFSQAVLEQVLDLEQTYEMLYRWLKPGGLMSHEICFNSYKTSRFWNGHWAYSDFKWKLIKGKRASLINREPLSKHKEAIKKLGFNIIYEGRFTDIAGIQRKDLAPRFKNISDEDFITSSAFIQAKK